MISILTKTPDFRFHFSRYVILILYALLITHLLSYGKLPFTNGYHFPWLSFGVISVFSLLICTTNWIILKKIKAPKTDNFHLQILKQLGINIIATIVIFSILFPLINHVILGYNISWFLYFKYLLVCFGLVISEVSILKAIELYKEREWEGSRHPPAISKVKTLRIRTGSKEILVKESEIGFFHSKGGIIRLFMEGKQYTTDFTSLDELEKMLDAQLFFRANRQYLLSRHAIKMVQKDVNRKLLLTLDERFSDLSLEVIGVSRYKRGEFRGWFGNG